MSIRARIHAFQIVALAVIVVLAAVTYGTIRATQRSLGRAFWAHQQLEAVLSLKVNANRFSEQIAELLLVGEPERPDFESARAELEAGFDRLEKTTKGENAYLAGSEDQKQGLDEFHRLARMRELYSEITQAVAKTLALNDQNRQAEAIEMFRRDIENRLDAEFENLLKAAELDEREEVEWIVRRTRALWWQLTLLTAGTALVGIALIVASGFSFVRSLARPIKLLMVGVEAVSRGRFDHRIAYDGPDELGKLARQFNQMSAAQEDHRALQLRAQSDLELQVEERTRELGAANKRLTDLDRLRIQFLADISHELRTPLTALRGEAEVTLRHGHQQEAVYRDTLERIVVQVSEMGRLVEDLLFLARTESDTIRFELRPMVLQDLVKSAARDAEVLALNRNITIESEYAPDAITIDADGMRLKQAIMIILDNAIKYSPRGGAISVRVADTKPFAEVAVRDDGVGIPAADLPNIFERFYRGRMSSAPGRSGSGLGLGIAKWLIEKHGGGIAVESEEGAFTEVKFRIPRREVMPFGQNTAG